jgi:hypothetical protein
MRPSPAELGLFVCLVCLVGCLFVWLFGCVQLTTDGLADALFFCEKALTIAQFVYDCSAGWVRQCRRVPGTVPASAAPSLACLRVPAAAGAHGAGPPSAMGSGRARSGPAPCRCRCRAFVAADRGSPLPLPLRSARARCSAGCACSCEVPKALVR